MSHAKQAAILNLSQRHYVLTRSLTGVTHKYYRVLHRDLCYNNTKPVRKIIIPYIRLRSSTPTHIQTKKISYQNTEYPHNIPYNYPSIRYSNIQQMIQMTGPMFGSHKRKEEGIWATSSLRTRALGLNMS